MGIIYKGNEYPDFQGNGNAARFCMPFANEWLSECKSIVDICANNRDWAYVGARMIDVCLNDGYDALNLPDIHIDGIFSSHGLEHLERPFEVLDYWHSKLAYGGKMFLYLPNMDGQVYHRPWHNRKHLWYCNDKIIKSYFDDRGDMWGKTYISDGSDLYNSFMVLTEKK